MKKLTAVILLAGMLPLTGSAVVNVGDEIDFVASALPKGEPVTGPRQAAGTFYDTGFRGIMGWIINRYDSQTWPTLPSLIAFKIGQELKAEGWKSHVPQLSAQSEPAPRDFIIRATRKSEKLEIVVTLFPETDGTVKIADTQRRSS